MVLSLPPLPTAAEATATEAAEATKATTAAEATKAAALAEAVAKATAAEAITKTAAVTPTTEPVAPTTTIETAEPVLACAARLLFAVCPRRVTPGGLPAVRRVLLPTVAGVPVHVAVGVGIVIVADARRTEGVGLTSSRVVRCRLRRAPIAFWTGGRRRIALDRTAARTSGRYAGAIGALPRIRVVVFPARHIARGATGCVERAVIALPGLPGVGVVAAPRLVRARGPGAHVRVGPTRGRADRPARGLVP